MTPAEIAELRRIVHGFRGRFFFDAERGDLAYIDKRCDDRECECERKTNSDGDQDCSVSLGVLDGIDDVMEPIAEMLNATPALIARVEELERERGAARRLAAERYDEAEACHALLGEPYQSGAVAALTADRDRLRTLLREAVEIGMAWAARLRDQHNDPMDRTRLAAIASEGGVA